MDLLEIKLENNVDGCIYLPQFVRLIQDPMFLDVWPMELPSRFVNDDKVKVSYQYFYIRLYPGSRKQNYMRSPARSLTPRWCG